MPKDSEIKSTSELNSDLMDYVEANLDARLKKPFVSKDYTLEDKKYLIEGLQIALVFKQLDRQGIIEMHKAMNPNVQTAMRFLTRRGGVCLNIKMDTSSVTKDGLLETLDWLEKHQAGYGPRFQIVEDGLPPRHYFTNIAELRKGYGCEFNVDLAEKLVLELSKNEKLVFRIIPILDSMNPVIDKKPISFQSDNKFVEFEKILREDGYSTQDVVGPKFFQLVDEFNQLQKPSIEEIASFIKSMLLLHPFPNGNGRVFTLGVLNSLLYNNGYGICLNLNPYNIVTSASAEIAKNIQKNLVLLNQIIAKENNPEINDSTTPTPPVVTGSAYSIPERQHVRFFSVNQSQTTSPHDINQESCNNQSLLLNRK